MNCEYEYVIFCMVGLRRVGVLFDSPCRMCFVAIVAVVAVAVDGGVVGTVDSFSFLACMGMLWLL